MDVGAKADPSSSADFEDVWLQSSRFEVRGEQGHRGGGGRGKECLQAGMGVSAGADAFSFGNELKGEGRGGDLGAEACLVIQAVSWPLPLPPPPPPL